MDEKIIIAAADIVLSKLILNDPLDFKGSFPYWIRENNGNNIFTEIILAPNDNFYNEVHGFLLRKGYIGRWQPLQEIKYLTEKGDKVKQLGGHENYIKWVVEQERQKTIADFPKTKWYIYDPLKIIVGILITAIISGLGGYFIALNKSASGATKVPQLNKTLSMPKISNRKDSALK